MDLTGQHLEIDAIERCGGLEMLANVVGAGSHVAHAQLLSSRNRIGAAKRVNVGAGGADRGPSKRQGISRTCRRVGANCT